MTNKKRNLIMRVLPMLIASAYASGALAQEKLEEVVVTAQKRKEKVQDVPISITAISGAQLEMRGIEGNKDLSAMAPSLMVSNGNSGSSTMSVITIRGSGTGTPGIYIDTSVGTYVDGVYVGKNQGGLFDVLDLDRVEVLRGPQGTMFGRNTLAGAINFVTRKPSGQFSGSVGVDVGNYGSHIEKVSVDLPKMGGLSLSLAARNEKRDGYVKSQTGQDAGKVDKQSYRLAANWEITSDLQAFYSFDHTDVKNTPLPVTLLTALGWRGPVTAVGAANTLTASQRTSLVNGASTAFPSSRNPTPGFQEWERMKTDNHALTLSYNLNANNTIKYIFSDRKMNWSDSLDLDSIPADIYAYMRDTKFKSSSHELQWVGNTGRLKYVAGYYLYEEDAGTYNPQESSGTTFFANDFTTSVNAKALYGQLDYAFNDQWSGSLGIRRSIDEKGVDSSQYGTGTAFNGAMTAAGMPAVISIPALVPVTTNAGDILNMLAPTLAMDLSKQPTGATSVALASVLHAIGKHSFGSTTPAASLTYKVYEGLNVYGRYAKGFRAGGFNAETAGSSTAQLAANRTSYFNPEKSTTLEMGFKSNFWGGKAQLNGAIYQNKVTDAQTSQTVTGSTSTKFVNAGEITYQGFELEGQMVVADGWRVGANWGHLNPKIKKYLDNALTFSGGIPTNNGPIIDTASDRVAYYAPKNTFNLNVDGRLAKTAWGTLRGVMDINYTDKMYNIGAIKDLYAANAGGANLAELCLVPSRTIVNARLILAGIPVGGPGQAEVSLWVRNLADVRKVTNYIDLGFYRTAIWTEPRMVGLNINYKW